MPDVARILGDRAVRRKDAHARDILDRAPRPRVLVAELRVDFGLRTVEAGAATGEKRGRQVHVDVGDLVTAQTRVLSLEPLDLPLLAILYVPAGEGKSISDGFEVRLSPSTVRKEEYGVCVTATRSLFGCSRK